MLDRRTFVRNTSLAIAGLAAAPAAVATAPRANPLPRWKGFNFLDFFVPDPSSARPAT